MRANPHLLEINTRRYIRKLSEKYQAPLTFSTIPDAELQKAAELGFDGFWLLGVWKTSERARKISQSDGELAKSLSKSVKNFSFEDISAPHHAVSEYELDPSLGKPEELLQFKEKLNRYNLQLFLDFFPNHTALDHRLIKENPGLFVHADKSCADKHPDVFFPPDAEKNIYIAHGRDPNFPPWNTTAQLNHFNPETREFLTQELIKVSGLCDGVRCNKVMLTLNDVFAGTWGKTVSKNNWARPGEEFWPKAIEAVRAQKPYFYFLGEVYWGLEWQVQRMGFDYTYDQVLYDRLRYMSAQDVRMHLSAEQLYRKRSIRFIDNHNEPSPAQAFGKDKSKAAAVIISTIEGLRLFNLEQIRGLEEKVPSQYLRCLPNDDPEYKNFYHKLLAITNGPAYHGGEWVQLNPAPADNERTHENILSWQWTQGEYAKFIIVNYSARQARARIKMKVQPDNGVYSLFEEFGGSKISVPRQEMDAGGFLADLAPYSFLILSSKY